jgi:hypothetical protein
MDAQTIQTVAAVIQGVASLVFLGTVWYDARERRKRREQDRRDKLIAALLQLWLQTNALKVSLTDEERCGFYSERQIEFINSELRKRGERWSFLDWDVGSRF